MNLREAAIAAHKQALAYVEEEKKRAEEELFERLSERLRTVISGLFVPGQPPLLRKIIRARCLGDGGLMPVACVEEDVHLYLYQGSLRYCTKQHEHGEGGLPVFWHNQSGYPVYNLADLGREIELEERLQQEVERDRKEEEKQKEAARNHVSRYAYDDEEEMTDPFDDRTYEGPTDAEIRREIAEQIVPEKEEAAYRVMQGQDD